jgi:anti-anti-sigma factor
MGVRMLISIARAVARKNVRLVLFAPQEGVREVFDSVSLGDIIPIRDTEADAVAALQA